MVTQDPKDGRVRSNFDGPGSPIDVELKACHRNGLSFGALKVLESGDFCKWESGGAGKLPWRETGKRGRAADLPPARAGLKYLRQFTIVSA